MVSPKLVGPDRDEGAVRVETTPWVSEDTRGPSVLLGRRVVSIQLFAGAHELAQPASCE